MSFLLAIEGGDGAGKGTAAAGVAARLHAAGRTATVLSFPRYRDTVGGHVIGELLGGRLPQEAGPRAAAMLYALDRLESRDTLLAAAAAHDVVVLDRYVASNMAYQAARVPADERAETMAWILRLERDQCALPPADLTIYLDTPMAVSRTLIRRKRERSYTTDAFDRYEADDLLQRDVRANYAAMAAAGLGGAWLTVATTQDDALRPPDAIAAAIVAACLARLGGNAGPVPDITPPPAATRGNAG